MSENLQIPEAANENEASLSFAESKAEARADAGRNIEDDFSARIDAVSMPTEFVDSTGKTVECRNEEESMFALQQAKLALAEELFAERKSLADEVRSGEVVDFHEAVKSAAEASVAEAFRNREKAKLEEMKTDLQYKSMTGQLEEIA